MKDWPDALDHPLTPDEHALASEGALLARVVARSTPARGMTFDEKLSAANWGLLRAVRHWREKAGINPAFIRYACKCMRNWIISEWRQRRKENRGRNVVDFGQIDNATSSPDEQAVINELAGRIDDARKSLNERERAVIALMAEHGMGWNEIAATLELDRHAVYRARNSALDKLRSSLGADHED
jgi:RNA polymerase sigma factor (sigma-70 family)